MRLLVESFMVRVLTSKYDEGFFLLFVVSFLNSSNVGFFFVDVDVSDRSTRNQETLDGYD